MAESTLNGSKYGSNSNSHSRSNAVTGSGSGSRSRRNSRRHSSLSNAFAMIPLKRRGSKATDNGTKGNSSGSRGEDWDELPVLETVPSIGTQAVETGSSVRVHGGNPSAPREEEEGRTSGAGTYGREAESNMSSESQRMIIRKEVDIHVQSDGR